MLVNSLFSRGVPALLLVFVFARPTRAQEITLVEPGFVVIHTPAGAGPKDLQRAHGDIRWGLCGSFETCLYVSDPGIGAIRRFEFGEMPVFAAGFTSPVGMAFGPGPVPFFATFIYVADRVLGTISRVSPTGEITSFASVPAPWDCTFDPSGAYGSELFVSTAFAGPIWKVNQFGVVRHWIDFEATYLQFAPGGPWGSGLYAASHGAIGVGLATISPSGAPSLFVGGFSRPGGFDWVAGPGFDGDLFATDADAGLVYRIRPSGERTVFARLPGATAVATQAGGHYLVVCSELGACHRVTQIGTATRRARWNSLKAMFR